MTAVNGIGISAEIRMHIRPNRHMCLLLLAALPAHVPIDVSGEPRRLPCHIPELGKPDRYLRYLYY